jgi:predicted RNA-binding Zn ribbon-like protein
MSYTTHSNVRVIAGRLALDFLNTANWTADGDVLEEKIETFADLDAWMMAVGLPLATHPSSIDEVHQFRADLRAVFRNATPASDLRLSERVQELDVAATASVEPLRKQPILSLISVSALSILTETRELSRVKMCPGSNCGWIFLDETKNARRKWCIMETCGNRAKAARNYARRTQ